MKRSKIIFAQIVFKIDIYMFSCLDEYVYRITGEIKVNAKIHIDENIRRS